MRALLDVSMLLALFDPKHVHHNRAQHPARTHVAAASPNHAAGQAHQGTAADWDRPSV
jgi:hypothetical protein